MFQSFHFFSKWSHIKWLCNNFNFLSGNLKKSMCHCNYITAIFFMKKKLYNEMIEIISQHSIPKKCAWECAWEDEMKHFHE